MKKILMIGNQDISQKSIKHFLEMQGCSIVTVDKFLNACDEILDHKYDLIISCHDFSGGTVFDILKHCKKKNALNATVPFILVTAKDITSQMFNGGGVPDIILHKDQSLLTEFKRVFNKYLAANSPYQYQVLFIDDDKFIQKTVKLWLKKYPHINLTFSSSIKEAQAEIKGSFDLIVSDYLLEDGDLFDLLNLYQVEKPHDQTPFIAYTGSIDKVDLAKIPEKINFLAAYEKPFKVDKFLEILDKIRMSDCAA